MLKDDDTLDMEVTQLLEDPAYADNPLREVLHRLHLENRKHLVHIERISRISDRYLEAMRNLNTALFESSTRDELTGLANRRLLKDSLKIETARANRMQRSYVLAMLDVDHFKHINDQYGHDLGDAVLVSLSEKIMQACRKYDVSGRWGGEEFILLLPETGLDEAILVITRLLESIRAMVIHCNGMVVTITASVGMASYRMDEPFVDTIHRADAALFEAKAAGRNCFRLAPEHG